jgi:hypothetical protein
MATFYEVSSWDTGAVHLSKDVVALKDLLIVFVHGIRTNYKSTWLIEPKHQPEQMLASVGIDADVLVFAHPSCLYHQASVEQSAAKLHERIETAFPEHRHRNIVLVTHSLGGLVVKQMLCDIAQATHDSFRRDTLGSLERPSIWARTRLLMNIDTPHRGGIGKLAFLYPLYAWIVRPIVCAMSWVPSLCRLPCWPWGTDNQLKQLRTNNPFVLHLEQTYSAWCKRFSSENLPSPVRYEFPASVMDTIQRIAYRRPIFDPVTKEIVAKPDDDQWEHEVPGGHTKAIGEALPHCAQLLKAYYSDYPLYMITERTLAILLYNKSLRIDRLLQPQERLRASIKEYVYGLDENLEKTTASFIVVEGDAGLGKSTVARFVARQSAIFRLKYGRGPIPLLFPLGQLSIQGRPATCKELWHAIIESFCRISNEFAKPFCDVTPERIERALSSQNILLIIDALEEFLMNHPLVSREMALELTRQICDEHGSNRRLCVVVNLRHTWFTQWERNQIALGDEAFRLDQPADDDLIRQFPWMRSILEQTKHASEEARRLIRSPLVAKMLETVSPDSAAAAKSTFNTAADVYEFALEARMRTIELSGLESERARCEAIRVVGWELFIHYGAAIVVAELAERAVNRCIGWVSHLQSFNYGHQVLPESPAGAVEPATRRMLSDDEKQKSQQDLRGRVFPALIRRSFFTAYDDTRVTTMHREIEDYLAASYMAECIRFRKFEDLSERGATVRVFELAAQRLDRALAGDSFLTPEFVEELWAATKKRKNRLVFGNTAVVISYSTSEISREFYAALLNIARQMDSFPRHIILGGYCYAAHRNSALRPSNELRKVLEVELAKHYVESSSMNVVTRSLAWCYLKAFGIACGEWRRMRVSAHQVSEDVNSKILVPPRADFEDDHLILAWEVAFEELLATFEAKRFRAITIAHYILIAAGTNGTNLLSSKFQHTVWKFLKGRSHGYQELVNDPDVPELKDVIAIAEELMGIT